MTIFTWDAILQFINGTSPIPPPPFIYRGTALTVGSFDGPHIGHAKLIEAILNQKKENGFVPGVLTFRRPLTGYKKGAAYKGDVSTLAQRLQFFKELGVTFVVVIDFSDEFCKIEGRVFLEYLVKFLNMKFIAEGKDFHCGYRGSTGMDEICSFAEQNGIKAEIVPPVLYGEERVSSSRIREDVLNGDFGPVNYMLARPYKLDCLGLDWKVEEKENTVYYSAVKNLLQVIPAEGKYPVRVLMSDSSEMNSCRSELIVESQFLRLQVSQMANNSIVRAIEFI